MVHEHVKIIPRNCGWLLRTYTYKKCTIHETENRIKFFFLHMHRPDTMGATSSMVLMPSGTVVPVPSPTGGGGGGGGAGAAVGSAAAAGAAPSTAVVPAGAGAAFPKPHPGDGSMDFTKTEMVTPETSLNMSIGAFLSSLGLEQLREVSRPRNLTFLTAEFRIRIL